MRAELAPAQAACAQARDEHQAAIERREALDAQIKSYHERIAAMLGGSETFSIESLHACRRYLDQLDARRPAMQAEVDRALQAVHASDARLTDLRRRIAQNRGRIDVVGRRIVKLRNLIEAEAVDAEDEEAEEQALARLARR